MAQSKTNPKVDAYINEAPAWREELKRLRKILLGCQLTEEVKWGKPCYTFQGGNVVLILPLKNYCALLLCKGALLKDPSHILVKAGENTQAARQIRFTQLQDIVKWEPVLKAYLQEAIEAEKAGLEVEFTQSRNLVFPEELTRQMAAVPALKTAFAALTPGRQRAYNLYFSSAKQPQTREARIKKCLPRILKGKGLNDP